MAAQAKSRYYWYIFRDLSTSDCTGLGAACPMADDLCERSRFGLLVLNPIVSEDLRRLQLSGECENMI